MQLNKIINNNNNILYVSIIINPVITVMILL